MKRDVELKPPTLRVRSRLRTVEVSVTVEAVRDGWVDLSLSGGKRSTLQKPEDES
jgi:hypothetical protein